MNRKEFTLHLNTTEAAAAPAAARLLLAYMKTTNCRSHNSDLMEVFFILQSVGSHKYISNSFSYSDPIEIFESISHTPIRLNRSQQIIFGFGLNSNFPFATTCLYVLNTNMLLWLLFIDVAVMFSILVMSVSSNGYNFKYDIQLYDIQLHDILLCKQLRKLCSLCRVKISRHAFF
uniref:Uncharacterized protein n=1 Tax=Glossina brevipalpis TaxID=37001 RepID=A0A1A9WH73_9MUSC